MAKFIQIVLKIDGELWIELPEKIIEEENICENDFVQLEITKFNIV